MMTTYFDFPRDFILDCIECDCDVGEIEKTSRANVRLCQNVAQREELRSRAFHYANGGLDAAPRGLVESAKVVLARLESFGAGR